MLPRCPAVTGRKSDKIMAEQKGNPRLTITLTGRRPVTIIRDQWPIIAAASHKDWDNQYECQANRTWKYRVNVRQHEDGRTIVYGIYEYDTRFQNENCAGVRGGEMVAKYETIEAIKRVGKWMADNLPSDHADEAEIFNRLVNECIADLPAEEL
jgi:hypothetical protein